MKLDDLPGDGCLMCGASLEHKRVDAIYCGPNCYMKHVRALERESRWEARADRVCQECGGPIPKERQAGAKWCSSQCHRRAADRRHRAKKRAQRE